MCKIGTDLIAKERQRQIDEEGWTRRHDDVHTDCSLAMAAVCYAAPEQVFVTSPLSKGGRTYLDPWPFEGEYDKRFKLPSGKLFKSSDYTMNHRIDLLVKAGALIAAEIDRLQRAIKAEERSK